MTIEEKPYDENSSEQEIEALKLRVTLEEGNIVLFKEAPIQTAFSVTVLFDQIASIAEPMEEYSLLIDLTEANRPGAKARKVLNERLCNLGSNLKHVAYFTGKNFIINTAIKFVMYGTGSDSYSVHTKKEDALKAIGNV